VAGELPHGADADAAVRQLYSLHATALHSYVQRFCPDRASADDIVQETFIRAWRHLPQLVADDRPVRPWLFRVARNLLTDANRAARSRPVTVQAEPADDARDDAGLDQVLDRQLGCRSCGPSRTLTRARTCRSGSARRISHKAY
jgi:RNA polymerase sigma-70 factor, ECF subfamily